MANIIDNDPNRTQYLFGTDEYDVFSVGGPSTDYGFEKTDDGGVVIWHLETRAFDIIYDIEEFNFADKGFHFNEAGEIVECPDENGSHTEGNQAPVATADTLFG